MGADGKDLKELGEEQNLTQVLRHFLDENNRLIALPAKQKMRLAALSYLAKKLDPDTRYTEQSLNDLLNTWHVFGDPATLRRELYNHQMIDRLPSGKAYWRLEPIEDNDR